jgi:hypothetical protein
MTDTLIVWALTAFTCLVGIVAVVKAVHANKIKHGEIVEDAKSSFEKAHA